MYCIKNVLAALAIVIALYGVAASPYRALASGTARIQQPDGNVKVYKDVLIRIKNKAMALTSHDHAGTIILGKAACTKVGDLFRCIPYDATLEQYGKSVHITLAAGTVYLNPTKTAQTLTYSSTKIPPHGVLLSIRTKRGTYVSLSGVVDQVQK